MVLQIHEQKGDFTHYVDPVQIRVELDAVKNNGDIVYHRHIAKVHVTMALTNEAILLSLLKRLVAALIFFLGPALHETDPLNMLRVV